MQDLFMSKAVARWLLLVCFLIVFMVVFGGLVRLTRSGLSIVEWNVITGVVPPLGEKAWQQEFAKYQQTPEYQKINYNMTLEEYRQIFYLEYFHRLIARLAGLAVVLPLLYFLWKRVIPWRRSARYLLIAVLFAIQGAMGWYMVSSGLVDRPAVSHFRLTLHLLLALTLLALTLRTWLHLTFGRPAVRGGWPRPAGYALSWLLIAVLVLQIAYGGLVAGLKAGHASNTWPLMFGYLVPPGLLSIVEPWWRNLLEAAATVHFVHRWFAFVVLLVSLILWWVSRRHGYSPLIGKSLALMIGLVAIQIGLGISVVVFGVPLLLALAHQFTALCLFIVAVFLNHRLGAEATVERAPGARVSPLSTRRSQPAS